MSSQVDSSEEPLSLQGMLRTQFPLQLHHTFGLPATARLWKEVQTEREAIEFLMDNVRRELPLMVLGGGSNVVFTQDYPGIILKNKITGIRVISQTAESVLLGVGGGESWPDLVTYALSHDWGGLENLSMIPGSVGAAPIQNIGAYGVELKNCFESLRAVHLKTGEAHEFDKEDCAFGYRESCFKNIHKGAYLITEVRLRLTKAGFHQVNLSYGTIEEELEKMGVSTPTIHAVSQAVCRIRTAKLPDPAVVGNAGSFFKNPVIPSGQFEQLQAKYSQVPYYPAESGKIKVPAAWLIDQLGWKGRHIGGAGVHERQALVLVNVGDATGSDLQELAGAIQKDVFENFGISLTPEVNLIPNDLA